MYFACRSIIESLSPVHATWTRPAFTVVIVLPLFRERMARSEASRHPSVLRPGRRPADLAHGLAGLLGDVPPAEERHEHVVRDECRAEAPEPRSGLEPVEPRPGITFDVDAPADHVQPADERRHDTDQQGDDCERVDAPA